MCHSCLLMAGGSLWDPPESGHGVQENVAGVEVELVFLGTASKEVKKRITFCNPI